MDNQVIPTGLPDFRLHLGTRFLRAAAATGDSGGQRPFEALSEVLLGDQRVDRCGTLRGGGEAEDGLPRSESAGEGLEAEGHLEERRGEECEEEGSSLGRLRSLEDKSSLRCDFICHIFGPIIGCLDTSAADATAPFN